MRDPRRRHLERLERNPTAVPPKVLIAALRAFGYELKRQKGSHQTYTRPGMLPITVPYRRPHLGRVCVDLVIARLRQELAMATDEETADGD